MKKLALVGFVLLAGCRRDPQPVTVVSPATRPDLKVNAFLLSNNALLTCKDWIQTTEQNTFQLLGASGGSGTQNKLTHDEPPIEGFDGSFNVRMQAQPLLGSSPSVLKRCAGPDPEPGDEHRWDVFWKIWSNAGAEVAAGNRELTPLVSSGGTLTVEFQTVSGDPAPAPVKIARTSSGTGSSWNVTAPDGATYQDVGDVKSIAGQSFRMSAISLSTDPGNPITLTAADQKDTCASFKICHDKKGCELETPPPSCRNPIVDPRPGHDHEHPRR